MTFKGYLLNLVNGVPHEVYIILLVVFCLGAVGLIGVKGWSKGLRYALGLLLTEYVFLLYASTAIFRKAAKVRSYDFTPFWSYSKPELMQENIMNAVVFVPVGVLIGFMLNGSWTSQAAKPSARCSRLASSNERQGRGTVRHGWLIALATGLCISGSIEGMQFFLKRGFSEVDDVMHNTVGCILGYMLVKGLWLMVNGLRRR